jgi:hypothetical protein
MCSFFCTGDATRGCSGELVYGGEPPLSLASGLEKAIVLGAGCSILAPLGNDRLHALHLPSMHTNSHSQFAIAV